MTLIFKDKWNNVTKMITTRRWPAVAALDNKIYVTGGENGTGFGNAIDSVDCYDPDTNSWSQVANMKFARKGHAMVSLHGRLYAIGGGGVNSIEVFDPDNNTWTLLQHELEFDPDNDTWIVLQKKLEAMEGKVSGAGLIKKYMIRYCM